MSLTDPEGWPQGHQGGGVQTVFSTLFNKAVFCHMLSHWALTTLWDYQQVPQQLRINSTTSGLCDLPPPLVPLRLAYEISLLC